MTGLQSKLKAKKLIMPCRVNMLKAARQKKMGS